jgi:hypothetical protein
MAGSRDKVKIHIHADQPGTVFELAGRYGAVSGQKAEDMTRQAQARVAQNRRAVIVTDSGADLPEEICEKLGIHTVPLRIHFADRTFLDKVSLTPAEFLKELATSEHHPKTSQPAPGDLRRVYDFLASHYEHVIVVSLLGRVSGTLQASRMAARRSTHPERITVIDSHSVSVGQGLIAMYAAECAGAGLPLADVVRAVARAVAVTRLFAVVSDLDYATRGGRLPRIAQWLATIFPVLPVLRVTGSGVGLAGVFRRGGNTATTLFRHATRNLDPRKTYRFAIAHAGLPERAAELRAALATAVPAAAGIYVTELGPAASVHGGPGSLGVAVQEYVAPGQPGPAIRADRESGRVHPP